MNLRIRRVSELVKQEVSEIVRRDVSTGDLGLITVTGAEVASDLKTARVYVSMIGPKAKRGDAIHLLQRQRLHIQNELRKRIVLKYIPHLEFEYDDSLERGDRLLQIMDELEKESGQKKP
jgi:ribosome-binding factor A